MASASEPLLPKLIKRPLNAMHKDTPNTRPPKVLLKGHDEYIYIQASLLLFIR